ncbi:putative leucine-rich repeat-containing, plant-type, leucine-rich repeat domain, L [Rosa chinensis]|uniref:Putative leucine-rich repeat-containing, plant-type, leucine-rich repeat domain, L n=1 Tax=Rosa chinensis TaxID=74649 RepID=A0A2P6REI8_ROSCH|nr:putative leucine-rich repeat-containing, plant-type, leucine-rich repeat domain, L [Rosa chinensis]
MPTLFLHFFLFLFTTTVTNLIPAVHSNCIEAEKQSLLHFKKSLEFNSSKSTKLITWNSSTDRCSWLGVTCSTNGRVVGLDLSREFVSSSIDNSSSLFQLQHIQSLNLAYNNFYGSSIPSAIGKLANLRYLNLRAANFSGQIPIEVACLKRLKVLDVSDNDISKDGGLKFEKPQTPIEVACLKRVKVIDLSDNDISEDGRLKFEELNLGTLIQNPTELTELNLDGLDLSAEESDWYQTISSSIWTLEIRDAQESLGAQNAEIQGRNAEMQDRLLRHQLRLASLRPETDLNSPNNLRFGSLPISEGLLSSEPLPIAGVGALSTMSEGAPTGLRAAIRSIMSKPRSRSWSWKNLIARFRVSELSYWPVYLIVQVYFYC